MYAPNRREHVHTSPSILRILQAENVVLKIAGPLGYTFHDNEPVYNLGHLCIRTTLELVSSVVPYLYILLYTTHTCE